MVEQNKGKVINLTYDKRKIINPDEDYDKVTIVETKPWGHRDIHHYLERIKTVWVLQHLLIFFSTLYNVKH